MSEQVADKVAMFITLMVINFAFWLVLYGSHTDSKSLCDRIVNSVWWVGWTGYIAFLVIATP